MMAVQHPPYYQNFDGTHCLQCSLRSALEHFHPEKTWTWEELDALSGKTPGKATWQMQFLANVGALGYDVVCIEDMDLKAFADDPEGYLRQHHTGEELEYLLKSTDCEKERLAARALLDAAARGDAVIAYRNSTIEDIKAYLAEGYVIILWVNSKALSERSGLEGHFVLVYDAVDERRVEIHDNGGLFAGKEPVGSACWKIDLAFLYQTTVISNKTGGFYALKPKREGRV